MAITGPPLHVPVIHSNGGPVATHDYACPVCHEAKAVITLHNGLFQPCGECQRLGWRVVARRRWADIWPWWGWGWTP